VRRSGPSIGKRRSHDSAARNLARYGEGAGTNALKIPAAKSTAFTFSSPGLALIGLRRRDRRGVKATG
jgi:hypothetical protein